MNIYVTSESEDKSTVSSNHRRKKRNQNFTFISASDKRTEKFVGIDFLEWDSIEKRNKVLSEMDGIIALDNMKHPCGCVFVYKNTSEYAGCINNVYVYSKYRGQGLGSELLQKGIELGGNHLYIYLDNEVAIKMYEEAGFEITQSGVDSTGEECARMDLNGLPVDEEMINGVLKIHKRYFGRNRKRKVQFTVHRAVHEDDEEELELEEATGFGRSLRYSRLLLYIKPRQELWESCLKGSYPGLLRLVEHIKTLDEVQWIRNEYRVSISTMTKTQERVAIVEKKGLCPETKNYYKGIKKYMDKGITSKNFAAYIKWCVDVWGKAITDKRAEIKKAAMNEGTKEDIPKVCPACGGQVICTFKGEPVYICKECEKYFGTRNPRGDVTLANEAATWSTKDRYPVYIVSMHTGTPFSNVIKKFTGDEFSHVAIAFNSKLEPLYSFGTRTDTGTGGFEIQSLKFPFFKTHKVHYKVFVVYVNKKAKETMLDMVKHFEENIDDYHYDFIGCAQNFFHIGSDYKTNTYFCSRFVAEVLSKGMELAKAPSLYKPQDVADLENISIVNGGDNLLRYDYKITERNCRNVRSGKFTDIMMGESYVPEVYSSYYVSKEMVAKSDYVYINKTTCSPTLENALERFIGKEVDLYVYTDLGPGKARCIGEVHLDEDGSYEWTKYNSFISDLLKEDMAPVIGSGAVSTFVHQCMKRNTFTENPEDEEVEYITSRPGMTDIFRMTKKGKEKLTKDEFREGYEILCTYEYVEPMTTIDYLKLVGISESGLDFYKNLVKSNPYEDIGKDPRFNIVPDFFTELATLRHKVISEFLFTLPSTGKVMDIQRNLLACLDSPISNVIKNGIVNENAGGDSNTIEYRENIFPSDGEYHLDFLTGLVEAYCSKILESIH